jgi:large subunit ribosomal protein L3
MGPCYITQIKFEDNFGYNAIQLGYVEVSHEKLTKPESGHFQKVNLPCFQYLKEYKTEEKNYTIGQKFTVEMFEIGQTVNVSGLTIGKGNTGNIKEHNFSRGPMTHGSKHHRLQGSLSAGTTPGRVFRGKRMPRRVGNQKRTILGLEIIDIDKNENLLVIKGSIPGKPGNLVSIGFSNLKLS